MIAQHDDATFSMCERCRAEYEHPWIGAFIPNPMPVPIVAHTLSFGIHGKLLAPSALPCATVRRSAAVWSLRGSLEVSFDCRCVSRKLSCSCAGQTSAGQAVGLMYPTLASVRAACDVSALEARLMFSSSPIVLLRRRSGQPATRLPAVTAAI
jgi:hydrogenase maturation factor HypF (carbamoyltransferase family)